MKKLGVSKLEVSNIERETIGFKFSGIDSQGRHSTTMRIVRSGKLVISIPVTLIVGYWLKR